MYAFDDRRYIAIAKDKTIAIDFAADHWITIAKESIQRHGAFYVALSGGSTPAAIFKTLATQHLYSIDWTKVFLFWSDERSVPPSDKDSNFHMSMESGLKSLPILPEHIFRMHAEEGPQAAETYEQQILITIPEATFDLIMLGMGEDGHTASLFPHTEALQESDRLVVMNYVPEKTTWRMTFTYPLINRARNIVIYVLGNGKEDMVEKIFTGPTLLTQYPIQNVGTPTHRATWIMDVAAASRLELPESACLF